MTPRRPRTLFQQALFAALCCAPLATGTALATTMVDVPLDSLAERADLVVRGTVVRTGTRVARAENRLEPFTHVWIRVDEVLAGVSAPNQLVHVVEPGGSYGDVQTLVAGSPHFALGEQVVVFLARDPDRLETYRTLDMTQGKYHVLDEAGQSGRMAVRDLSDVSMVRWRRSRMQVVDPGEPKPVSVDAIRARVRALRQLAPSGNEEVKR